MDAPEWTPESQPLYFSVADDLAISDPTGVTLTANWSGLAPFVGNVCVGGDGAKLYYSCDVAGTASSIQATPTGLSCVKGSFQPSNATSFVYNKCFQASVPAFLAGQVRAWRKVAALRPPSRLAPVPRRRGLTGRQLADVPRRRQLHWLRLHPVGDADSRPNTNPVARVPRRERRRAAPAAHRLGRRLHDAAERLGVRGRRDRERLLARLLEPRRRATRRVHVLRHGQPAVLGRPGASGPGR